MNQNGICQFCGKRAKLVRQSHVISNFLYHSVFDEKNRMNLMSFQNNGKHPKTYQSGFFDKYLYCYNCENNLWSKLEKYGAAVFIGQPLKVEPVYDRRISQDGFESLHISNLDYNKFKLFFLSNLWRAHNSPLAFFKHVDIEIHKNIISQMILNSNAETELNYPVSVVALKSQNNKLINIVLEPSVRKNDVFWVAIFFIGGYLICVDLAEKSSFVLSNKFNLKSDGTIEIPILSGQGTYQFLHSLGLPESFAYYYAFVATE